MKLFEKKSMKNVQIFLEKDITNLLELRNMGEFSIFDEAFLKKSNIIIHKNQAQILQSRYVDNQAFCIMTCFENHAFRPTRIGAKVTIKHRVLQIITLGRIGVIKKQEKERSLLEKEKFL